MRWIQPKYSKKKVRKAGDVLRSKHATKKDLTEAYEILSNWRSAHAYPMHALLMYLRRKSKEICATPIVVQRLKRSPSIISKLRRISGMSLDRMQDIGGCRSVLHNVAEVRNLTRAIKESRIRHILHNEKDYISNPKESGYRCVHLIYKYNATKEEYKDFFIELQLRTQIQHAWATAVEVVDIFTKQALKVSYGDDDWKKFFYFVSLEFARLESAPVKTDLIKGDILRKISELERKLSVTGRLEAFAVTTKHIEKQGKRGYQYYILTLDAELSRIEIVQFEAKDIARATDKYLDLEKQFANNKKVDVVLVSGDSINSLKSAYPNYFADTQAFSKYYKSILEVPPNQG